MDQSRSQCPLLKKKDAVQKEAGKAKENKYDVKPPRDLRSKYLIKVLMLDLFYTIVTLGASTLSRSLFVICLIQS